MSAGVPQSHGNRWIKKIETFLLYDVPVGITYLSRGVQISTTVLIKGKFTEADTPYIVLANGSLIPLAHVISIDQVYPVHAGRSFVAGNDEIAKFQLPR